MFITPTPLPPPPPTIEITYIGGPTTIIEIDGYRIITDPTFDPAKSEYPGSATLVKTMDPAIPLDDIGKIDLVLLTHDEHADNLDHKGRELLGKVKNTFTTQSGATRIKENVRGFAPWESATVKTPNGHTLRVTATPARHGPVGIERLIGDVVGFVVTLEEAKQDLVYITGDTVWYDGLEEISRRFKPRTVLTFSGAAAPPLMPMRLTMDSNDAIEVAKAFPESVLLPVHTEGWAHFRQPLGEIQLAFAILGFSPRLGQLKAGEPVKF